MEISNQIKMIRPMDYQTKLKKTLEKRYVGKKYFGINEDYAIIDKLIMEKPIFNPLTSYYPHFDLMFYVIYSAEVPFVKFELHLNVRDECIKFFNLNPFFACKENIKDIINI